jgi:hypothetical protein
MIDPDCAAIRQKFDEAMHERDNAENSLGDSNTCGRWERFEKAKRDWEAAIQMFFLHLQTCPHCPKTVKDLPQASA